MNGCSPCSHSTRNIFIHKAIRPDDAAITDGNTLAEDSIRSDVTTIADTNWSTVCRTFSTAGRPLHRIVGINLNSCTDGAVITNI
jgi:hypothetical protein